MSPSSAAEAAAADSVASAGRSLSDADARGGTAPIVDLIVLAGGRGSRLGGAVKPAVEVAGRTLLSRVLDAAVFARRVVIVGPDAARAAAVPAGSVLWALEDPPFGGPVAGIAAGLSTLSALARDTSDSADSDSGPDWVLVLACDLPWAADAARLLVASVADPTLPAAVDGVHLVDADGREQWLAGAYRPAALAAGVARLGEKARGASVRQLLTGLSLRGIRADGPTGMDVDTWEDVQRSAALLRPPNPPN